MASRSISLRGASLAVVLASGLAGCRGGTTASGAGQPFPPPRARVVDVALPRLGGGQVSLRALRGHPVVITMFTTWSLRCQAEAPLFVQLHERQGGRGLRVVGIALSADSPALLRTYVDFVGFRFDVAVARPDDLEVIGGLGATRQVPRTLVLDAEGRVVRDEEGLTNFPALARDVERLLSRSSATAPKGP